MYLYLVEIVDTCVKVGITGAPTARIAQHAAAAKNHRREVGRTYISIDHPEARANEAAAIKQFSDGRSEYLTAEYDTVAEYVSGLPMTDTAARGAKFGHAKLNEPDVRLLTIPGVAALLKLSRSTVYRMIERGDFRSVDIGHGTSKTRIRSDDLDNYVENLIRASA